ncbi:hypothetical protein Nepgr_024715 [Nepenthes gracilis]|uniref:Uncharacterized protein n=1 Tax=Nepenthes gracilis TaxID=150966 RepID=A0AAD3XYW1_NEPGR|nr:hypothetical protein Nepgr_024715 [Nepenthes gracilis]
MFDLPVFKAIAPPNSLHLSLNTDSGMLLRCFGPRSYSVIAGIALRHITLLVLNETRHFFVEECDGTAGKRFLFCWWIGWAWLLYMLSCRHTVRISYGSNNLTG